MENKSHRNSKEPGKKEPTPASVETGLDGLDSPSSLDTKPPRKARSKEHLESKNDPSEVELHRPPGTRTKIIHLIYENKINHSARQKKIWIGKVFGLVFLIVFCGFFLHHLNKGFWAAFHSTSKSFSFESWWEQMVKPVPLPGKTQRPPSPKENTALPAVNTTLGTKVKAQEPVKVPAQKAKINSEKKPPKRETSVAVKKEVVKPGKEEKEKAKTPTPPPKKVNRRP